MLRHGIKLGGRGEDIYPPVIEVAGKPPPGSDNLRNKKEYCQVPKYPHCLLLYGNEEGSAKECKRKDKIAEVEEKDESEDNAGDEERLVIWLLGVFEPEEDEERYDL